MNWPDLLILRLIIFKKMLEGCLFFWIVSKDRLGVQEAEVSLGCCLSFIHLLCVWDKVSLCCWVCGGQRGLPQLRFMLYFETGYLTWTQNLAFCLLCESPHSCALNYSGLQYLPVIQVYSLFILASMCFIHGTISLATHLVFEVGFLTGLELTIKLRWGGQADPRDIVLAASLVLVLQVTMLDIFYVGSGDWTQVLILSWQTLFPPNCLPQSQNVALNQKFLDGVCCLRVALENKNLLFCFL